MRNCDSLLCVAEKQCLFYGLDDDLQTGLVFYGREFFADETIFYRPIVDIDWRCIYFSYK